MYKGSYVLVDNNVNGVENIGRWETNENMKKVYQNRINVYSELSNNMQQILLLLLRIPPTCLMY